MKLHPCSKALMKKTFSMGIPVWFVALLYGSVVLMVVLTQWFLGGIVLLVAVILTHVVLKAKYRKDPWWLSDIIDGLKRENFKKEA